MAELNQALHAEGMLLTAAVSAGKATIDPAYNVPEISKSLDLINVMTYDLHGAWDDYTHHQSGLYAHPLDEGDNTFLNVVCACEMLVSLRYRCECMSREYHGKY